jgi:pimeloyl-ACP methyl ester carboxylesterase
MAYPDSMAAGKRFASSTNMRKFSIPVASSMSGSEEDLPPFPEPEISSIKLDTKPGAKICYTYYPASTSRKNHSNPFSQTMIVYLNGIMSSRTSWDRSIHSFLEKRIIGQLPYPGLLSYDRYGQGDSDRDPTDKEQPPCHGHDAMAAVQDLRQLIEDIWRDHLDLTKPTHFPCLIFVCNSIGCAIARLFAQQYPRIVSGLLFLDSIMANSDSQSFWPDPDAPDFNSQILPHGVTEDDVRETRRKYKEYFHPEVPNMEGLSRRNLAKLLPHADLPQLEGYLGRGPYLTVVGHDWETFAQQSLTGSLRTPKILTMTYANPAWRRYNEGLVKITDEGRAIGPIVAVGCGHFIQNDGPEFVSDELVSLLDRVVNRVEQVSERDGSSSVGIFDG